MEATALPGGLSGPRGGLSVQQLPWYGQPVVPRGYVRPGADAAFPCFPGRFGVRPWLHTPCTAVTGGERTPALGAGARRAGHRSCAGTSVSAEALLGLLPTHSLPGADPVPCRPQPGSCTLGFPFPAGHELNARPPKCLRYPRHVCKTSFPRGQALGHAWRHGI